MVRHFSFIPPTELSAHISVDSHCGNAESLCCAFWGISKELIFHIQVKDTRGGEWGLLVQSAQVRELAVAGNASKDHEVRLITPRHLQLNMQ